MENIEESDDKFFAHRKLASVQIIKNLKPVEKSKDEIGSILGWKVVVPANKYKEGEKVIFFEIDSWLPAGKKWTSKMKPKNLIVKTTNKHGEIIQGLVMKLQILSKIENCKLNLEELNEGYDLTEILEVKKFDENSEEGKKEKEKGFPTQFIEKSDEIRLQSNLHYLEMFAGKEFYSSIKYDGTSATYLINPENGNFKICSRNFSVEENDDNFYSEIAKKYDIKNKLIKTGGLYAIQGEIYGPKINKNPLEVNERKIAVFNIKNIKNNYYLGMDELIKVCKELDLPMVEIVEEGIFNYKTVDELVQKSKGLYPGTQHPREGLVYRLKEHWNEGHKRCSFKVINDDYLIDSK